MKFLKILFACAGLITTAACSNSSKENISEDSTNTIASEKLAANNFASISGPQLVVAGVTASYQLNLPVNYVLLSVTWNFGEGASVAGDSSPIDHTYFIAGSYSLRAVIEDADHNQTTLTEPVTVIAYNDNYACAPQASLNVPDQASVGTSVPISAAIPACLQPIISQVSWTFGDGTSATGVSTQHTFTSAGNFLISAQVVTNDPSAVPTFTLTQMIQVNAAITPTPSPTPVATPLSTPFATPTATPTPVPTPTPTPVPLNCNLPNGSVLISGQTITGIVTGTSQVAVVCSFNETGINSSYQQLSDFVCSNGVLSASNVRQGTLISAGVCPSYDWSATSQFTTCSADCGGSQNRIYECLDNRGSIAPAERCANISPVESQACDGNPAAVARVDSTTTQDEGGSTNICPAHQIGVTVQIRDKTENITYACIDHRVQVASDSFVFGAWQTESYCRNYVAQRCSQDSLSNDDAHGRYQWMLKCQDQVPQIREFLTNFESVNIGSSHYTIDSTARTLYPTFMNTATLPEKPWIAPKTVNGNCIVPTTAYVAAVCVSSCATPEQEILTQARASLKMKYAPIVEALTGQHQFVATLQNNSSMNSKLVVKTSVQQWVTEMLDTQHDILEFHMASGRSLRLTPNHTVVTEQGSLKTAAEFSPGENLVQLGGELDLITSIDHTEYFGKVYNVFVNSADLQKNIVITNGYLNGTAFYQNEGAVDLNRVILRTKLSHGIFN